MNADLYDLHGNLVRTIRVPEVPYFGLVNWDMRWFVRQETEGDGNIRFQETHIWTEF